MIQQLFTSLSATDFRSLLAETVQDAVTAQIERILARPQEPQKLFLTRKEVSTILGVSLVTLNDWNKSGIVPCYRVGSRIRYRFTDIQNALQKKGDKRIA